MVLARVANVKSGWKSMFMVSPEPKIIPSGVSLTLWGHCDVV